MTVSQREDAKADEKNPWRVLTASMDATGVFVDPGKAGSDSPIVLDFEAATWDAEVDAIGNRWQVVHRPTYAVQAIKEAAIQGRAKPHGAEKHGAEWGEVLHSLLEALMKQPEADLRGLALSALAIVELPISLVDDAIETVQRVVQSEIWGRARRSESRLTEVPVTAPAAETQDADELPTVLRGVIDLVFREGSGWVIVDYKSERVDASELPALVDYYKPQIAKYAEIWAQTLGVSVAETGLLFTHSGQYVLLLFDH
jgi:ATP-dependent exoDNAse (exonuclease V) beta subunit